VRIVDAVQRIVVVKQGDEILGMDEVRDIIQAYQNCLSRTALMKLTSQWHPQPHLSVEARSLSQSHLGREPGGGLGLADYLYRVVTQARSNTHWLNGRKHRKIRQTLHCGAAQSPQCPHGCDAEETPAHTFSVKCPTAHGHLMVLGGALGRIVSRTLSQPGMYGDDRSVFHHPSCPTTLNGKRTWLARSPV
jgi:hypothetical protein